jgi:hypothetical protein
VITRSGISVSLAVAIVAAGVVIVIAGGGQGPETSSTRPTSRTADPPADPLLSGRGATYPGSRPAAAGAPGIAGVSAAQLGKGVAFATRMRRVRPCSLLRREHVTAAVGQRWRSEPYSGPGVLRCRWVVDPRSAGATPEAEINLTVSRAALFKRLRAPSPRHVPKLGDEAIVSARAGGGLVAAREDDVALVLALSSDTADTDDAIALSREALAGLQRRLAVETP